MIVWEFGRLMLWAQGFWGFNPLTLTYNLPNRKYSHYSYVIVHREYFYEGVRRGAEDFGGMD